MKDAAAPQSPRPRALPLALPLLLAFSFAARLGFCRLFPQSVPGGGIEDQDNYHELALSLCESFSLKNSQGALTAHREPGYPLVLAGLYSLFGPRYWALCLLHALLGTASVYLVFLLGKKSFSPAVGLLAACMAAVNPQFLYYGALARRETLQAFLCLLGAWALLRACEKPSARALILAGAVWAFHALTNSAFLPTGLAMAAALWLMLPRRGQSPAHARPQRACVLYLSVFLAVYSLWPLRNALVFGRFVAGITQGAQHLYVALIVPNDAAGTPREHDFAAADPVLRSAEGMRQDERDAMFYRESARWVLRHPAGFLGVMAHSGLKLWRLYPYARDYGMDYGRIRLAFFASDAWIIPLGLIGLLLAGRRIPDTDLYNLILGSATLTYMIFWAVVRYRVPLMPFVFIYAAHAMERLWDGVRRGSGPQAPSTASRVDA